MEEFFARVREMIETFVETMLKLDKRGGLTVLVYIGKKDTLFEELKPVWVGAFGEATNETRDVAMSKAKTSWETGYSTRRVSEMAWFLNKNNIRVWPGALCFTDDGTSMRTVIAVSGLTARHDETVARVVFELIDTISDDVAQAAIKADGIYRIEQ